MPKGIYPRNPWATVHKRFFSKIEKSGNRDCWLWKGYIGPNGYGMITTGRGNFHTAHRMSYILHYGKVPKGKIIMHICDHKICVNPDHLEVGTYTQNLKDAYKRGLRGAIK